MFFECLPVNDSASKIVYLILFASYTFNISPDHGKEIPNYCSHYSRKLFDTI